MNQEAALQYKTRSTELRADLKRWESEWAQLHQGSKPSRKDIKNNPDIARKYKEYNNVRDIIAGKKQPPQPTEPDRSQSRKRRSGSASSTTPPKRMKHIETPSKNELHQNEVINTPATSRKLFSPSSVTSIGPTPQRDGRVLGLFDILPESDIDTPSKQNNDAQLQCNILATPGRRGSKANGNLGRTPKSTSKRRVLGELSTPIHNQLSLTIGKSPISTSKLLFDTPAFLKRQPLQTVDENTALGEPVPLKLPKKPLMRGLSEIIANLRKVEDERLDDDLDALRDIENEQLGKHVPGSPTKPPQPGRSSPNGHVEDREPRRLPLNGSDDEAIHDSSVEDGVYRDGSKMTVYKKKGQKRTTRKVTMKPIQLGRPANLGDEKSEDNEGDMEALDAHDIGTEGAQDSASDNDGRQERKKDKANSKGKKEGAVKKTLRKVNELAHANFRKLKLRNRGAKGGPAHNSKFRRRR
ncbi:hypothetical protein CDD81_7609 [Ophiocordyceps australis]|uniref:DNA replication regulator SLD2 n=1 Tax=Ophiocordyceps australis TaxID=1399860 RepID=A0A2C5Y326_9HYPO|nr:hypothetical protein CDD81_7609 [Ophiocordyceps australis]